MKRYKPVNLHGKNSQKLVIHCSDPRFQRAYREMIDSLNRHYDLMVLPGASKAAHDLRTIENIVLLHGLHGFRQVHIMDHIDCGAFGKIDDEIDTHSKALNRAEKKIKTALPRIKVFKHLLGEHGELELA